MAENWRLQISEGPLQMVKEESFSWHKFRKLQTYVTMYYFTGNVYSCRCRYDCYQNYSFLRLWEFFEVLIEVREDRQTFACFCCVILHTCMCTFWSNPNDTVSEKKKVDGHGSNFFIVACLEIFCFESKVLCQILSVLGKKRWSKVVTISWLIVVSDANVCICMKQVF